MQVNREIVGEVKEVEPAPPVEPAETKPGWATTEFWVSTVGGLVVAVLGVVFIVFRVAPDDQTHLTDSVTQALTAIGTVAGVVWTAYQYVKSRTTVKVEAMKQQGAVAAVLAAQRLPR